MKPFSSPVRTTRIYSRLSEFRDIVIKYGDRRRWDLLSLVSISESELVFWNPKTKMDFKACWSINIFPNILIIQNRAKVKLSNGYLNDWEKETNPLLSVQNSDILCTVVRLSSLFSNSCGCSASPSGNASIIDELVHVLMYGFPYPFPSLVCPFICKVCRTLCLDRRLAMPPSWMISCLYV